jgi:hypothetical protein
VVVCSGMCSNLRVLWREETLPPNPDGTYSAHMDPPADGRSAHDHKGVKANGGTIVGASVVAGGGGLSAVCSMISADEPCQRRLTALTAGGGPFSSAWSSRRRRAWGLPGRWTATGRSSSRPASTSCPTPSPTPTARGQSARARLCEGREGKHSPASASSSSTSFFLLFFSGFPYRDCRGQSARVRLCKGAPNKKARRLDAHWCGGAPEPSPP